MSGPKPDYPINLTEAERKKLEELVRAHKSGQTQVMRAQILLNADAHAEWSNKQIGDVAGTSDRIVRKWRGRWVATHSIADAPRSGAPRRFSPSSACASHSTGLQFAKTERSAFGSLVSKRHRTTHRNQDARRESPFQENSRTLAEPPSGFDLGDTTTGNIFMTLNNSFCEPDPY